MNFYRCLVGSDTVWMTMAGKIRFLKENDHISLVLHMFCGTGMMEGGSTFEPTSTWLKLLIEDDEFKVDGDIFM